MSYRLHAGESPEAGLRRLAADQLDRGLGELDDPELDPHTTVHQVRKRCKKLRGLLRLVRPGLAGDAYSRENGALRDAQRGLSGLRDAEARIETFDALIEAFGGELAPDAFAPLRRALEARRDRWLAEGKAGLEERLTRFREALGRIRERTPSWELERDRPDVLARGLARTYGRGRRALDAAYDEGSTRAFHEWRKRVKYHAYHVRLLREAWPPVMKARLQGLARLSDLLGDEHDLAVLRQHLLEHPVAELDARGAESFHGLAAARRTRLRLESQRLGRRVFADRPKALARRMRVWLDVAWSEAEAGAPEPARDVAVAPPPALRAS